MLEYLVCLKQVSTKGGGIYFGTLVHIQEN